MREASQQQPTLVVARGNCKLESTLSKANVLQRIVYFVSGDKPVWWSYHNHVIQAGSLATTHLHDVLGVNHV